MKITILCTSINHAIWPSLSKWKEEQKSKGHEVSLINDKSELFGGDLFFLVSCGQLIKEKERLNFKQTLVLHASDLPKSRGWSPHIWNILEGNNKITVSLFECKDLVDSGKIWLKESFQLDGHELLNEINEKLFTVQCSLMDKAIEGFSTIDPQEQVGKNDVYHRIRTPEDSRIDLEKSIKDQFNLLRVVDSDRYPAFFEHLGYRYEIKITKAYKNKQ